MKKNRAIFIFLFLFSFTVNAQQTAQFSQYLYNCNSINPAFNGNNDRMSFLLMHRSQWIGINGAPSTQMFNFQTPLLNQKLSAGTYILTESIGARRFSTVQFNGAYHIRMNKSLLSFGFRAGIFNWHVNASELLYENTNDPASLNNAPNSFVPNFDAGIFYNHEKFFIGASCFNLTEPVFYNSTNSSMVETGNQLTRHFFAIAGYRLKLNENIQLRPSALVKYELAAPVNFDASVALIYKDKLHFALTYRSSNMVSAMLQFYFNSHIHAGYAFDYTLNDLNTFITIGTHEIFFGYDLFLKTKPMVTPRFL